MGRIKQPLPVLRVAALFSRYDAALDWALQRIAAAWGSLALVSPRFPFEATQFYERSMGTGLEKLLVACEPLVDPAELVESKLASNAWEEEYAALVPGPEPRPLNIDPGYLSEAKLVLASTKDRDHRLYLDRGIYAEQTLYWQKGHWNCRDWTYPDYQRADYHAFLTRCREYLRERLHASRADNVEPT